MYLKEKSKRKSNQIFSKVHDFIGVGSRIQRCNTPVNNLFSKTKMTSSYIRLKRSTTYQKKIQDKFLEVPVPEKGGYKRKYSI